MVAGIGSCSPIALHFSHASTEEDLKVAALFDATSIKLLHDNLPISNQVNCLLLLNVIVQLHEEGMTITPAPKQQENYVHGETSLKSLLSSSTSIFVGICEESDESRYKDKLKIGSTSMNLLSTMSVTIGNKVDVNIGPETRVKSPSQGSIFYQKNSVEKIKQLMKEKSDYHVEPNLNNIRQAISGFNDPSTYKPYRASWEPLMNNNILLLSTIFTLCDLLHTGYGVSNTAAAKIGSRVLNQMAAAACSTKRKISKSQLEDIIQIDQVNGTNLKKFLQHLESELNEKDEVDILVLGNRHLSSLAAMVNQSLSTANKKIKENVEKRLISQLGERKDIH
ncbi:hypothetical protein BDA99DRAFT_562027 [Phascolomyces articulosus]|uniref:Uncharacterized protein n=1 Tax=Phascolomyces articulosus TaxID=60185 RepID=A0AAD5K581_9FUNG|nr:hypothetical protein BDA99DRAFT_562027 [Phascolomyces articulosus]